MKQILKTTKTHTANLQALETWNKIINDYINI